MFEQYNSSGYDLYQPFPDLDQWVIDDHSNAYHGTLKEVVKYMISRLDFEMDDIEDGLNLLADYMQYKGDNAVHMGAFRSAIFTFKKEVNCEQAS